MTRSYFLSQPIRSVYDKNYVEIALNPTVTESTFWHSQSDRCMPKKVFVTSTFIARCCSTDRSRSTWVLRFISSPHEAFYRLPTGVGFFLMGLFESVRCASTLSSWRHQYIWIGSAQLTIDLNCSWRQQFEKSASQASKQASKHAHTAHCSLLSAHCSLLIAYWLTAYCPLAHCSLFIVHYSSPP